MEPTQEMAVRGEETEASVEGLAPATQYLFTLHAHNAMGPSKPSEVGVRGGREGRGGEGWERGKCERG